MRILGCWYSHFDPLNLERDRALLECSLRSVEKMAAASESAVRLTHRLNWMYPAQRRDSFRQE